MPPVVLGWGRDGFNDGITDQRNRILL